MAPLPQKEGFFDRPDRRLLLFTKFKDALDYLVDRLRFWGFHVGCIHGGMKSGTRDERGTRLHAEQQFRDGEIQIYQGKHEPLVSIEMWERVQGVMDGRWAKKAKRGKHDFAFSGLIGCAQCGCAVVGEIKKDRYVYYHCTGYADKCQGNPASCRRKNVREKRHQVQAASGSDQSHVCRQARRPR
jgi:Recombinase zinc beta ribbon domain